MVESVDIGNYTMGVNDVQKTLVRLRERGWTLAAIGRELGVPANTVRKWSAGLRYPANAAAVKASLVRLSKRKVHDKARQQPPAGKGKGPENLSPEVRAGLGLFKDLAPGRSAVDELIRERRREAARE